MITMTAPTKAANTVGNIPPPAETPRAIQPPTTLPIRPSTISPTSPYPPSFITKPVSQPASTPTTTHHPNIPKSMTLPPSPEGGSPLLHRLGPRGALRSPRTGRCLVTSARLELSTVRHGGVGLLGVRDVRDERFGREQQRRDRRRILQGNALNLGRVDDPRLHHVDILVGLGVEAARDGNARLHFFHDHGALEPGVLHDLADRLLERAPYDADTGGLVARELEAAQGLRRAKQRDAAPRHDAFLHGRPRGVERIFDSRLLLLHLGLGGRPDLDHGDAARELGEPLLELLPVVVRGRLLDLYPDLLDAAFDRLGAAGALDDRGVVLVHDHLLGATEVVEFEVLQLDA